MFIRNTHSKYFIPEFESEMINLWFFSHHNQQKKIKNKVLRHDHEYDKMNLCKLSQPQSTCDLKCYFISPQSVMTIFLITPPSCKPKDSILATTSIPSFTCPNTTCLPSSLSKKEWEVTPATGGFLYSPLLNQKALQIIYHLVSAVQMKNWEPLVFGPEFAIERVPAVIEKTPSLIS